jgi:hypothetical protein
MMKNQEGEVPRTKKKKGYRRREKTGKGGLSHIIFILFFIVGGFHRVFDVLCCLRRS